MVVMRSNMEQKCKVTFEMPKEKHRNFKSVCALGDKKMNEIINELIDVFLGAVDKNEN